ncbi:site-specific integrase [Paraburkholderia tropica]|uniref:hypothetical protein n=1 Tax=Paraburkholderia tropica TaxID=92647 RepID=UPI002AAF7FD4|nr:hypothetical protein [Paraburkholderia tropica]
MKNSRSVGVGISNKNLIGGDDFKCECNEIVYEDDFPFEIGGASWVVTQEIRDEFKIHIWKSIKFFDLKFNNESKFTDDIYLNMLILVQNFLRSLWPFGKNSLALAWYRLRNFVTFLVDVRGIHCFSQAWGVDEYVASRKELGNLAPRRKKIEESKRQPPLRADVLYGYVLIVKNFWHFSSKLKYGLTTEPWVGKTAAQVAGISAIQNGYVNRTLPYDLSVFSGFIRVARQDLEKADEACQFLLSAASWKRRIKAASNLRTSAVIVFLATEGMRPGEIYALKEDCLKKGVLKTDDGLIDVTWIDGKIFKGERPGGRSHRWIASDDVILAVKAMLKLRKALNKAAKLPENFGGLPKDTVIAIEKSKSWLFPKLRHANGNVGVALRDGLLYLKKYIQRPECQEFVSPDLRVNHSRFRPTIARAFARLRLGDVRYFMSHFGHRTWNVTMGYFMTFMDDEIQQDFDESLKSEAQDMLHNVLSSSFPLQGGKGHELEILRREYPVMTFESRKALVRTLQRGHHFRIGPQSLCMARNGSPLCSQDCLYEEENCLDCPNGVVTEKHLTVWLDMWRRNQELLREMPDNDVVRANQVEIEAAIKNIGGNVDHDAK